MSSDIDIFVLVYVINILVDLAPLFCWKSSGCIPFLVCVHVSYCVCFFYGILFGMCTYYYMMRINT